MNRDEKIVDRLMKEAGIKQAKIFDADEIVVLIEQVQGLNKGTKYKVTDNSKPGYITIADFDISDNDDATGEVIGEFEADKFVRFNNEC